METRRKNESQLKFVTINPWWNKTNGKEKRGWRPVKSKDLKKIDSWEDAKEESGNSGLANKEDRRDQNHR